MQLFVTFSSLNLIRGKKNQNCLAQKAVNSDLYLPLIVQNLNTDEDINRAFKNKLD